MDERERERLQSKYSSIGLDSGETPVRLGNNSRN